MTKYPKKDEARREVTDMVLDVIFERHEDNFKEKIKDFGKTAKETLRGLVSKPNQDRLELVIWRLQKKYENATLSERQELEDEIFQSTDYLPNYNHNLTRIMYTTLKLYGVGTFNKIKLTGHIDDVLEKAKDGRLVILPTHNDMFDTILVSYPFFDAGMRIPVFHAGENLRNTLSDYLMPRWNVLFVKRKVTDQEFLLYAKQIEYLLKIGENQTIYPEATRSREGLIAPVSSKRRILLGKEKLTRGMAKGYISALLNSSPVINDDIYTTVVTVNSAIFPDIYFDFRAGSARGARFLLLKRLFKAVKPYKFGRSDIYVNFTKPKRLTKPEKYDYDDVLNFAIGIRSDLKDNIIVLCEQLMAYTMKYINRTEPTYPDLSSRQRLMMLGDLYHCHAEYVASRGIRMGEEFDGDHLELAIDFYQKMGTLTSGYNINPDILMEYNSNRIQHFLREKLPLPT